MLPAPPGSLLFHCVLNNLLSPLLLPPYTPSSIAKDPTAGTPREAISERSPKLDTIQPTQDIHTTPHHTPSQPHANPI